MAFTRSRAFQLLAGSYSLLGGMNKLQVLGILPAVAPIPGAALGAALATEIVKTCEDVSYQRDRARNIGGKSLKLANVLDEASNNKEPPESLRKRIDEARGTLEMTHQRARKWRDRGRLSQWFYRRDMNKQMDRCELELDNAIQSFTIGNQVDMINDMAGDRLQGEYQFAQTQELLLQIAQDQADVRKILEELRSGTGSDGVTVLMRNGQEALKEMRENLQPLPSPITEPTKTTNNPKTDPKYREMEKGLSKLQKIAAILPPVKNLDGEVEQVGDMAVAGGSASDVWKGKWLGEKEVALKALRHVRVDDETAQRFYGYVTNLGAHLYLVSPWLRNGNVLEYLNENPKADKMHLLQGAAEGLRYLHSQDIIHGNIKCSNIMVSDTGEACISDFGMAKVLEDMSQMPLSTTIARSGSTRWLAPEIINGERGPSKASDTYSFGMTVLELLTGKHPFVEHKSDAAVIRATTVNHDIPKRPEGPEVKQLLTDDLWALLLKCWAKKPDSRPSMEEVATALSR
ncbi:hypothetical protein NP233_g9716 [Leucocoprinus birnbaumii]|uniref:Protein kinase domain-containing protein n=1 Tax=Leucocoprinus birnbaumii TaxID=56174 RepID=A0AAD5YSL7_9AGAR|nr:hypothetical protein NP233_g9716 [Leucocoprinus birnbaumii]